MVEQKILTVSMCWDDNNEGRVSGRGRVAGPCSSLIASGRDDAYRFGSMISLTVMVDARASVLGFCLRNKIQCGGVVWLVSSSELPSTELPTYDS